MLSVIGSQSGNETFCINKAKKKKLLSLFHKELNSQLLSRGSMDFLPFGVVLQCVHAA